MGFADFLFWPVNAGKRQFSTGPGKISLIVGVVMAILWLAAFWVGTNVFRLDQPYKTPQGADVVPYEVFNLPNAKSSDIPWPTLVICPRWNYWNKIPVQDDMGAPTCRVYEANDNPAQKQKQLLTAEKFQPDPSLKPCYAYNSNADAPGLGWGDGPFVKGKNWTAQTVVWCSIPYLNRTYDNGDVGPGWARFYFLDPYLYKTGQWGDCSDCEQGYNFADVKKEERMHVGLDPTWYKVVNASTNTEFGSMMYKTFDWGWWNDPAARQYDADMGAPGVVQVHAWFLTQNVWVYWTPNSGTLYPFWLWLHVVGGQLFLFIALHHIFTKAISVLLCGPEA